MILAQVTWENLSVLYIRLSSEYLLLDLQMSLVALFKIQCTAGQFIHVQRDLGKRGRPTVSLLCSRLISVFFYVAGRSEASAVRWLDRMGVFGA